MAYVAVPRSLDTNQSPKAMQRPGFSSEVQDEAGFYDWARPRQGRLEVNHLISLAHYESFWCGMSYTELGTKLPNSSGESALYIVLRAY